MNVYDFDETILDGDSEIYFFDYCLDNKIVNIFKRNIIRLMLFLEHNHILKYIKTRPIIYKQFRSIKNMDDVLNKMWDKNKIHIKEFYYKKHKDDDIVISATPRFILEPVMKRLKIKVLIATEMDDKYNLTSPWCNRNNKVIRYLELFNKDDVDEFYSDSDSDIYMARLAKKPYKVIKDKIIDWNIGER